MAVVPSTHAHITDCPGTQAPFAERFSAPEQCKAMKAKVIRALHVQRLCIFMARLLRRAQTSSNSRAPSLLSRFCGARGAHNLIKSADNRPHGRAHNTSDLLGRLRWNERAARRSRK
jgi:hypothetical protein